MVLQEITRGPAAVGQGGRPQAGSSRCLARQRLVGGVDGALAGRQLVGGGRGVQKMRALIAAWAQARHGGGGGGTGDCGAVRGACRMKAHCPRAFRPCG